MVANILPTDTPLTLAVGSKYFFSESSHVAFQIKRYRVYITMKVNILTHTLDPLGEVKGQIYFFSESGYVAYQIKGKEV